MTPLDFMLVAALVALTLIALWVLRDRKRAEKP
jgi:hypothetical protein